MSHWIIVAALAGWLVGTLTIVAIVYRRLKSSTELERVLLLVKNIVKDRSIPIDVEINQDIPVSLSGTYTLPTDLRMAIRMEEAVDIETHVPVRTNLPLDCVVESTILKIGHVKVPIQGQIPINVDIPVQTQAIIRSESVHVRLTEPLKLDLPQVIVPLRARLRVNIPLQLPELSGKEELEAKPVPAALTPAE